MESATLHEILSQPEIWEKILKRVEPEHWQLPPAEHTKSTLLFVGCGTSFYLAQSAAASFVRISGCPGRAIPSSEVFLLASTSIAPSEKLLAVAISRSGTTSETVWAAAFLREQLHLPVIALTCYADSDLAHASNWQMIIPEAQEKSVVMTRSFTSQLLALILASAASAKARDLIDHLSRIPNRGAKLLQDATSTVRMVAEDSSLDHFVFLGQGIFYGAANEAMLKTKEMSLSYSESFHTLEYRHGPMSIAGAHSLITFFLSDAGREHEIRVLADMKKLGARTLVLCGSADERVRAQADYLIELGGDLPEEARLLLAMPMIQLFAYYRAIAKNLHPDAPRHLSQVVTL
jgi:glucosamine--fructose-6-phosphate aminotransferase (isomerizing)